MMKKSTKLIYKAKDLCRRTFPFMSALVYGMPCRPSPDCPTLGVDKAGRCYFSEEFIETLSPQQLAYALMHECFHLALNHHKRRERWCPTPTEEDCKIWNIAADLCIQQSLARDAGSWEIDGIVRIKDFPGLPPNATTEVYADLLRENKNGKGKRPDPVFGGSCADGIPRPGEKPGEGASVDGKLAQVAAAIEAMPQDASRPGTAAGSLKQAIDIRLGRQPDPFAVLTSIVSKSIEAPFGSAEYTYAKLNRRQPANCARLRGVRYRTPECTIVVDTSGSMSPFIERAMTAVAQGLKRVQKPRVLCFDAAVQSDKRVASLAGFSWDGGGGTDMAEAIEYADKKQSDCIVCITDGETGWPDERTNARLVIAMVENNIENYPPPEWARVVRCWEGAEYAS